MNQENNVFIPTYKKAINVAISKALMIVFNVFGFGAFFSGLYLAWINVDIFTRSVLQFLGCIFMLFKIVQAVDNWLHKRKMNKYIREKEEWAKMIREEDYIRTHSKIT